MVQQTPQNDLSAKFIESVANLDEARVLALTQERIAAGSNPLDIAQDCQEGLRLVGEKYEQRIYYLAGLIMAGEIFRQVMELLQPIIEDQVASNQTGTILIGTVRGDIHDIGKNNLSMLLTSYGFTVHDLGVDVQPSEFMLKALQIEPQLIGLSGLLTSSYDAMKETIDLIRKSGQESIDNTPIIIGGNQLNEQVCAYVGADYWVTDAMTGVRLCQRLLS
jgi:5-methyltetrahydrofolate--homocysteine methyltransferase